MNALTLKLFINPAPAVTVAPKFHAAPKVPLKPTLEDQEIYGSVSMNEEVRVKATP